MSIYRTFKIHLSKNIFMCHFTKYSLSLFSLALMLLSIKHASSKTLVHISEITDTTYNPFTQDTIRYCGPDSLVLDAGANFATYQWNSGQINQLQKVGATGQYFVTVTNTSSQTFSDTVFVSFIQYDINGYKTLIEDLETNYSVTDGSLMVGRVPWYDGEIQQWYGAGTYWTAPEDGIIDSVSFIVQSYSSTYSPNVGITVYEIGIQDGLQKGSEGINLTSGGEKTIPLQISVQKGRLYKFDFYFGSFATPIDTDVVSLSTGNLEGYRCHSDGLGSHGCGNISNGVWIKLYGKTTSYNSPGNEFYSCQADSVLIDTRPIGNYAFRWSNGANTAAIKVLLNQSAKYSVDISNDFHTCRDSAILHMFDVPFNPFATDTLKVCLQESYTLNAATPGFYSYVWNRLYNDVNYRDSTLLIRYYNGFSQDGWKIVEAEGGRGCKAIDSVYVIMNYSIIKSYRFIGDGLYSNAANWEVGGPYNRTGKPPAILGPNEAIYINPSGICILDVQQIIPSCSKLVVNVLEKLIIQGNLILQ